MNDDQLKKAVQSIRERCCGQAREEHQARITQLQNFAIDLVSKIPASRGGKRYTVEDLCTAACQQSGISHPASLAVIEQCAEQLVERFVADFLKGLAGEQPAPKVKKAA